jgi:hypothetical protein
LVSTKGDDAARTSLEDLKRAVRDELHELRESVPAPLRSLASGSRPWLTLAVVAAAGMALAFLLKGALSGRSSNPRRSPNGRRPSGGRRFQQGRFSGDRRAGDHRTASADRSFRGELAEDDDATNHPWGV